VPIIPPTLSVPAPEAGTEEPPSADRLLRQRFQQSPFGHPRAPVLALQPSTSSEGLISNGCDPDISRSPFHATQSSCDASNTISSKYVPKDTMTPGPASGTASVNMMKIPVTIVALTQNIVSWNSLIERLSSPPSASGP
jgi:hypothetical protein